MLTYRIFQVNLDDGNVDDRRWTFFGWDHALDWGFNQEAYDLVYEGEIEEDEDVHRVLEQLFEKFNIDHPYDYEGRSLSVSDVVELDGTTYYVDSFGFEELSEDVWDPDFFEI